MTWEAYPTPTAEKQTQAKKQKQKNVYSAYSVRGNQHRMFSIMLSASFIYFLAVL